MDNDITNSAVVSSRWEVQVKRLQLDAHTFYFSFKHPRVRWHARLVAVCTAAYLFSPIQLIPSFIPVIGFLDDFLVVFLGVKRLKKMIPPEVLLECHSLAEAAETRRKQQIRSRAGAVALVAIASLWLLASVSASAVMVKYIAH